MTDLQRYRDVLVNTLKLTNAELLKLERKETDCWDSFSQMNLIAALEESFSIECELEDMADFTSYQAGIEILRRHGVEL